MTLRRSNFRTRSGMRPWLQSINDGTIDGEMARGQRALIYHGSSFSNTLILRAARETLGYDVTQQDHERLALLANMIGHALGDPHDLERKAGAVQEKVGDWFYRIPVGFGSDLLDDEWARCGNLKASLSGAASLGGDTRHSAEILKDIARRVR